MKFGLGSSFAALALACYIKVGLGRDVAHTQPVSLHVANAAEAAEVAEQAATVAKRVAAHTETVAHDTAAALRYTRDALKRAHADAEDIAEVGRQADKLDAEAGTTSDNAESTSGRGEAEGTSGRAEGQSSSQQSSSRKSSHLDDDDASSRISRDGSSVDKDPKTSGGSDASGGDGAVRGLDVNSQIVPYPSGVEPFGQEEPAKELTEQSVKQSDGMVDQIENAQGTEAKRAVYRALTKLRGATIASYDGMAKGHLKNVDNYNKKHKWRDLHPMKHLAEEEADTHIWAFPKKSSKKQKAGKKKAPAGISKNAASPAPAPAM